MLWWTKAASAEQKNGGGVVRRGRCEGLAEKRSVTMTLRARHTGEEKIGEKRTKNGMAQPM
jgi:hypothetical protein